jgi:hypothetical protein
MVADSSSEDIDFGYMERQYSAKRGAAVLDP